MKLLTSLLLMCTITLTTNAQKPDLLKGKWKFANIFDVGKLDSGMAKQAKIYYQKLELDFVADGKFKYNPIAGNPFSEYIGTWRLNKEQDKVTVELSPPSSTAKKTLEWEIESLSDDQLKLNMGNAVIVFNRPPKPVEQLAANKVQPAKAAGARESVVPDKSNSATAPDNKPAAMIIGTGLFSIDGYEAYKTDLGYGIRDMKDKLVFPAMLTRLDRGSLYGSFAVQLGDYIMEAAYFTAYEGGSRFRGDLQCDVCQGSGFVKENYHLSSKSTSSKSKSYLGNGVWEEVTITTTTPPRDVQVQGECKRCNGLGKMSGGITYVNGNVKVWFMKDEMNKSRN